MGHQEAYAYFILIFICIISLMIQYLGILSILLMWLGVYFLIKNHGIDTTKSISRHAAKNNKYHILFGIVEITVVTIFSIFIFSWFIPQLELGNSYRITAMIGIAGTVFAALVPDKDGLKSNIHFAAAYSMAFSLMVMNYLLFTNPNVNSFAQIMSFLGFMYMLGGWTVGIFNYRLFKEHMLFAQIGYFVAFQLPILIATLI
jgi:hypothetical protein